METQTLSLVRFWFLVIPKAASILIIVVGVSVLAGWALDIPALKSILAGWATMKPNTAACFVLVGLALGALCDEHGARAQKLFGRFCAGAVALVGLLTLIEYASGVDLGIDSILFREPPNAIATAFPGRMAVFTAFDFLLLGLALVGLEWETRPHFRPAHILSLVVAVNGLLAFVGYLYGAQALYAAAPYSSMALHTALLLVIAASGALCARPLAWPMDLLGGEQLGSVMARNILPVAFLLPLAVGWVRLMGELAGWYGFEFGLALFATTNVVIFTVLTWFTAGRLNRMDALRSAAEHELVQVNATLEQRILDRTAELEVANRSRDEFLTGMSHELRTPLNAIIGFSGTLLMELAGPINPKQRKQLETIAASGRHQLSLINDLLDLARIASGKIELNLEPINFGTVVHEVAETLRPLAERKGLGLEVSTPDEIVAQTDRRSLSQILINLVNNAIKFTERGEIKIDLACQDGANTISVTDTGMGIEVDDQARLFQAFARLDGRGKNRQEGCGLGLHLSQKLARLLGGEITFQSEPGKGSVFALSLKPSKS